MAEYPVVGHQTARRRARLLLARRNTRGHAYMLGLAAASFIYIATADLIPGLHRQVTPRAAAWQLVLLLPGIGTIALFRWPF